MKMLANQIGLANAPPTVHGNELRFLLTKIAFQRVNFPLSS